MKNGHLIGVGIALMVGAVLTDYGIKVLIEVLKALQTIPV